MLVIDIQHKCKFTSSNEVPNYEVIKEIIESMN